MQVGSCLNNQIEDYDDADQERAQLGQTPKYKLSKWGDCVGVITGIIHSVM